MMEQLERFENVLERVKMKPQIRLLNIVCDQKARKRVVTLTRSQRDEPLQFTLIGGGSIFKKSFQKARLFQFIGCALDASVLKDVSNPLCAREDSFEKVLFPRV